MFHYKTYLKLFPKIRYRVMRKSATAPVLGETVNLNFEEDEQNALLRILSDLRRESNTMIKVMEIGQKPQLINGTQNKKSLIGVIRTLQEDNEKIIRYSTELSSVVHNYDFRDVKANGFRSFLIIIQRCSAHLLTHIRTATGQRDVSNWNESLINEIVAFSECFHELVLCFYFLSEMKRLTNGRNLFPVSEIKDNSEFQRLIDESDNLKQEHFFGRCLGFYYCSSSQRILQVLGSIMSGYAHSFITNKSGLRGMFNTVLQSFSCFWNPENRGILMSSITRNATVEFTKQFWNLGEHPLVLEAPNMILPPVEVAVNFILPPVPFTVHSKDYDSSKPTNVTIYPPMGIKSIDATTSIKLRLISLRFREGLNWLDRKQSNDYYTKETSLIKSFSREKSYAYKERSKTLLIHCHGGGFVAQSAKSHDTYLRSWAERLDCPILSIDYSLAPEFPFPRALDECYYAVSWAIRNRRQLGCTSDAKIVLCGDSAGANLALCSTLKSIKHGTPIPDALFLAYVPVLVTMTPSPARLLASIDPLLPVGILARCLLAYVGIDEKQFISEIDTKNSMPLNQADSYRNKLTHFNISDNVDQVSSNRSSEKIGLTGLEDFIQSSNEKPSPLSKVRYAKIPDDPFMSPLLASDDALSKLPPISIIGSHFDPLLDDCVEFCKRLDQVGVPVTFKVMHDIPHGFLNFVLLSRECEIASQECTKMITQLFNNSVIFKDK